MRIVTIGIEKFIIYDYASDELHWNQNIGHPDTVSISITNRKISALLNFQEIWAAFDQVWMIVGYYVFFTKKPLTPYAIVKNPHHTP